MFIPPKGLSDAHNRFAVKPSYRFWAPWVGYHSRVSNFLLNTEYKKCHHAEDVAESGTRRQMNVGDVLEIFEQGSVSRIYRRSISHGIVHLVIVAVVTI